MIRKKQVVFDIAKNEDNSASVLGMWFEGGTVNYHVGFTLPDGEKDFKNHYSDYNSAMDHFYSLCPELQANEEAEHLAELERGYAQDRI